MALRRFAEVDVFTETALLGNPLAVVVDGDGLDDATMQRFANWTNFSETTFIVPPTDPDADYGVRIFTTTTELPFAGHPTLGTCHTWLAAGGTPRDPERIVQQCGVGNVVVRRSDDHLEFAAPPLVRSGPLDADTLDTAVAALGIRTADVVDAAWIDNGPGWLGILLASADAVLALRPTTTSLKIGVIGAHPPDSDAAYEVRAFFPEGDTLTEDPVTGSLNASAAQWLIGAGRWRAPYVATQGTVLGRSGRVHISADATGQVWVGGAIVDVVAGTVEI
jgi:PhzF family phenazine biosynthesis protein